MDGKKIMGRLTNRDYSGQVYYPACFSEDKCFGKGSTIQCNDCDVESKIAEKLAAYEDIIDEPEKLKIIDALYLERCEEINRLKAELAEYKRMEEEKWYT